MSVFPKGKIATLPERVVVDVLTRGVDAIKAHPEVLDSILADLPVTSPTENTLTAAKVFFAAHAPTIVMGYARSGVVMPCWAVTLASESSAQEYLGMGEEAELDDDTGEWLSNQYRKRLRADYTVFCYAENPDVCLWYYRILRRIIGVAFKYLQTRKMHDPQLSGADLAPDPRYSPENLFVRRVTLSVEYEEAWDENDALWAAFYPEPEGRFTSLNIAHEDSGGGVVPIVPGEEP